MYGGKGAFIKLPAPIKERGVSMSIRPSQQKAVAKYNLANYDRIELRVKKGQKDAIKAHAAKRGEALNEFVNRAITETVERDNSGGANGE